MDMTKIKLINDEMLAFVEQFKNKYYEKTMKNFAVGLREQMMLDRSEIVPKSLSYAHMENLGNVLIKRNRDLQAFIYDYILAELWTVYNDKDRDEVFDRLFNKRTVKHKYILDEYNKEELTVFRAANVNGKSWSVDLNVAINFWFIHTRNNHKSFYNIENIGLYKRAVKQSEMEFMVTALSRNEAVEVVLNKEAQHKTDNCIKATTLQISGNNFIVGFEDNETEEVEINEFYKFADVVKFEGILDLNMDYAQLEENNISYVADMKKLDMTDNEFFGKILGKKDCDCC